MADFDNLTIKLNVNMGQSVSNLNKLADALERINAQLDRIDPSRLKAVTDTANSLNETAKSLNSTGTKGFKKVAEAVSDIGKQAGNVKKAFDAAGTTADRIGKLGREAGNAGRAIRGMGQSAGSSSTSGFKRLSDSVKKVTKYVSDSNSFLGLLGKTAKSVFKVITAPAQLAAKAMRSFSKDNSETAVTARKLAKELLRVSKMFKLMITRMVLRQIIKGIGDGFKNLAQYSNQVNASMSLLWNSFRQLGNSIAAAASPLLNAFAPALNYIIQLAIKAVNAINQLVSALLGLGVWTRAKTLTDSYADSLKKAGGAAKELKKTVLGFDELNQLQDNKNNGGGGTSPADMFEQVPIEDRWKDLASLIKKYARKLFEPIKKAWEKVGDFVKTKWKYALDEVKKLGESVASDFWKVWEQKATQQIFENILKIIGYIGETVGNLAKRFREAWDNNHTGYKILCNIRDIFLTITEHLKNVAKATAEWADNLDFAPLLEAFNEWLESLKPVVDNVAGVFEDFYTTVLLPIGKWAVEEGGKELLQVFTDFNDKVEWDVIRERLQKVWDALAPFATTVGEGLITFIDKAADSLANFLNDEGWNSFVDSLVKWMKDVKADDVANGLDRICAALTGFLILKGLSAVTEAITGLMATVSSAWTVGNIITVIAEVATTIALLTDAIKDYKEALGKQSLWEALFDRSPEANDIRKAYANEKSSNPYNGNRENGEFKWSNLLKAFTDDSAVKAARETAVEIDKLGDAYEGAKIHAIQYDDANSVLMQSLKGSATQHDKITESLRNAGTVTPVLTEKQNQYADSLGKTSEKARVYTQVSGNTQKALDNLKKSTEDYTGVAPKFTKSQQDIIDSLGKVSIETENVSTETANAGAEMAGTYKEWSYDADKYSKDVSKSISDSMADVNTSLDSVKDGMTEDQWTFNGVIEGFKNTFKGIKDAVAPIWNEIADTLNGDHKTGNGILGIHLPRFANGGFPENGLLFANSTEMVGRFSNGKNVVANNEQITEGIARAVFNAISSANAQSGGGQYINNTIMVDGDVIARAVTKGQERLNRRYSPTMA